MNMNTGATTTTITTTTAPPNSNVTIGFGLALLKKETASARGKNIFLSPASVAIALAMTMSGARKATLAAMRKTLGFSAKESVKTINAALTAIIAGITDANIGVVLTVANAIWADKSIDFKGKFLRSAALNYRAQVNTADFLDPKTVDDINHWASLNTNGKIPTIIEAIPPDMVMYLLNAVYFKGSWTTKFDKALTKADSFSGECGSESIDMMFRSGAMRYSVTESCAFVSLPFGENKRVQLYILLPHQDIHINAFVNRLQASDLADIKSCKAEMEIDLRLPRFELQYNIDLKDSLTALGMEPACLPGADFSGMADANLAINTVKHKAYAKFDEEGGEAAAVAAVGMTLECLPMPNPQMVVNRPFVVALMDEGTDTLLFVGKVASTKK